MADEENNNATIGEEAAPAEEQGPTQEAESAEPKEAESAEPTEETQPEPSAVEDGQVVEEVEEAQAETPAEEGGQIAEGEEPPDEAGNDNNNATEEGDAEGRASKRDGEPAEGDAGDGAPEGDDGDGKAEGEGEEGGEGEETTEREQTPRTPLPQSDTFAEGERLESPLPGRVGEALSREGSPVEQMHASMPKTLEPGTPDRGSPVGEREPLTTFDEEDEEREDDEEEEEDDEEEEQPEFDREELIERYHQAIVQREQYQQKNYQLQHKLAEFFRKKKADDSRQDYDKNVTDQEQRYLKYMANLEDLRRQEQQERDNYKQHITNIKSRCDERTESVDEERRKFMEFKKHQAMNAVNSRSGRPIPPKDIEAYLAAEDRKDGEVINVRLENIKLKNKLKKKEHQLKSKEELAEGLHLIDFEQLKIENQTYNEKIEERNEELLKLRKKITSTVQVLTHLKEKLQYVQAENQIQKRNLREVEAEVGQKRDILSRTKQARDALRIDNQRLRQNCGLLGNESLLRDFEERKDEGDDLRNKLEQLKMQHAELTLHCNQVRRKIEQAKGGRA
ncbi:coiled-coil domain-containing protein 96-like isoform X2 [Dreissena polymorpha]|uniref:coiled-coil domain-containing protein 96-like isoform X2 n=1 Tax=Dreissena polymorpha TaxID=45954 RepID=UPI002263BA81|nr:coiled-coil domain-containing protein 96-like isoform X2 [Dreissena polymorpha]